ncbi:MAG: flagellar basal body rod protein FlgB [Herbaspirillum sp.]|jgi:flagellar basal-body rod protein FlgB|nr:flagellar basal body rod protein FlgB [Herbaspirillum sp.]
MAGKLDDFLNFNQNALNLRAQRQQLLASNIANADTPNYKARDINFAATLQSKLKQTQSSSVPATPSVDLARTSPMHIAGKPMPATGQSDNQAQYRTVDQPSADGNTVDMDVERVQYADNGLHYEADVTATSGQIKGLLSVIQGQ